MDPMAKESDVLIDQKEPESSVAVQPEAPNERQARMVALYPQIEFEMDLLNECFKAAQSIMSTDRDRLAATSFETPFQQPLLHAIPMFAVEMYRQLRRDIREGAESEEQGGD